MILIFPLPYVSLKKDARSEELIDVIRRRDEAAYSHEYVFIAGVIRRNLLGLSPTLPLWIYELRWNGRWILSS